MSGARVNADVYHRRQRWLVLFALCDSVFVCVFCFYCCHTKKYGNLLKVTDYLKMQHVRGYMTCKANALCFSLQQKSNQGTPDSYLVTDFH